VYANGINQPDTE